MGIKRKQLSIGDLVVYIGYTYDYPDGIDMGVGIITEINGSITVYWPQLWGRKCPGFYQHAGRHVRKLVIRETA